MEIQDPPTPLPPPTPSPETPPASTTPPATDELATLRAQLAEHRAAADSWETSRALYRAGLTDDAAHPEAGAIARAAYAALPVEGRPSLADWVASRPRALAGYLPAPASAAPASPPAAPAPPLGGPVQGAAPALPAATPPASLVQPGGVITAADHKAAQDAARRGDLGPLQELAAKTQRVKFG